MHSVKLSQINKMSEPCLCGAPDCPRCFPYTYKDEIAYNMWENQYPDKEISFETFLKKLKTRTLEYD